MTESLFITSLVAAGSLTIAAANSGTNLPLWLYTSSLKGRHGPESAGRVAQNNIWYPLIIHRRLICH